MTVQPVCYTALVTSTNRHRKPLSSLLPDSDRQPGPSASPSSKARGRLTGRLIEYAKPDESDRMFKITETDSAGETTTRFTDSIAGMLL